MIRHAFNLIWHRKRANALIIVELLVTFLILFSVTGFGLHLLRQYQLPLGFNVTNNWLVKVSSGGAWTKADDATFAQVLQVSRQLPEVAAAGTMGDPPFEFGNGSSTSARVGDINLQQVEVNSMSDGLPQALGMHLLEGRFFGPQDEEQGTKVRPIIVNKAFLDAFGKTAKVGSEVSNGTDIPQRIVGVVDQFRQHGQLATTMPVILQRNNNTAFDAALLVLSLKPGVSAQFEEQLLKVLQGVAPGWDFDVSSWTSLQQSNFRSYTVPMIIAAVVVAFLLLMVGFGLLGVLWQNIIRRTPEMGIRRAMGATAVAVRMQVVLELLAVASLALVLGIAIVVQFPLTGAIELMDWALFVPTVTMSALMLLLLCILFALYPSYQATRQDPVEALRYE